MDQYVSINNRRGYRLFAKMGQYVSINNRRGYRLFAKMDQYVSIAITVFLPEWVSMSVLSEWVKRSVLSVFGQYVSI